MESAPQCKGEMPRSGWHGIVFDACPPPEGAALGLCSGAEARTLFFRTVTEVILPRLRSLGLPAREAWRHRLG